MVISQQQIENVLAGTADYNFLPKALQSAIRLPIYTRACAVLAEPTRAYQGSKAGQAGRRAGKCQGASRSRSASFA
jgi:hypothetical protein